MKINMYQNIKSPEVSRNVEVENWLEEIKYGSIYKTEIERARNAGKGHELYDKIKCTKLPAVTWNFLFEGRKKDENIISSTGYLYFDIDGQELSLEELPQEKVYSFFSSLSNKGKGLIVRVTGITQENFKASYRQIAVDLGIQNKIDVNAVKKSQFTVLTYDPNIFINKEAHCFQAAVNFSSDLFNNDTKNATASSLNQNVPIGNINQKVQSSVNQKKREREHITLNCTFSTTSENAYKSENAEQYFFKYDNTSAYVSKGEINVIKEGASIVRAYLPAQIKAGKRKLTLLSYTNNLVWLNQSANFNQVYNNVLRANQKRCAEPLSDAEIRDVVSSIFKYKQNGTLNPFITRNKKVFFGGNTGLTVKEKQEIAASYMAEIKRDKTRAAIHNAIFELLALGSKCTAKEVSNNCGYSLRTVKTYWAEFKSFIKDNKQN